MGAYRFLEYHGSGSRFLMITMVLCFLFCLCITPFAFNLVEEINIELEMSESLEDLEELTEEFLKTHGSDFQYSLRPESTLEDINEPFLSSFKPDIPLPPPKSL